MLGILNKGHTSAQHANRSVVDAHMAVIFHMLRFLLKKRALGFDKTKSKVFNFKGQEMMFYHVQYVHRLEISTYVGDDVEGVVINREPRQYASATLVRTIINTYPHLSDYFIVEAPEGKTYSVWVRADAVDEAIRWLIYTLKERAPHLLDNFALLADENVWKAYQDFVRSLEDDKFKNN